MIESTVIMRFFLVDGIRMSVDNVQSGELLLEVSVGEFERAVDATGLYPDRSYVSREVALEEEVDRLVRIIKDFNKK